MEPMMPIAPFSTWMAKTKCYTNTSRIRDNIPMHNEPTKSHKQELQKSHFSISSAASDASQATSNWVAQSTLDYPPPLISSTADEFVATRLRGAERLKQLRAHTFKLGSYQGRESTCPVSRDIGSFEQKTGDEDLELRNRERSSMQHGYVKKTHWAIDQGVKPTYVTTTHIAYDEKLPPHMENRKGFKNSWQVVDHSVYPRIEGNTNDIDQSNSHSPSSHRPATSLPPSNATSFGAGGQVSRRFRIPGTNEVRMTSLTIKYNPYEPTGHESVDNRPTRLQPPPGSNEQAQGVPQISETQGRPQNRQNLRIPHNVTTQGLLESSAAKIYGSGHREWSTTQHSTYTAPPHQSMADIKAQREENFAKKQFHKYASQVRLIRERDIPVDPKEGYITETQSQYSRPTNSAVRSHASATSSPTTTSTYSSSPQPPSSSLSSLLLSSSSSSPSPPQHANPRDDRWTTTYMRDINTQFKSKIFH